MPGHGKTDCSSKCAKIPGGQWRSDWPFAVKGFRLEKMRLIATRLARPADVEAITAIYNEGIADRLATLETEARTSDERAAWLRARTARTPVLVAERNGFVVGWGSINTFNRREAYRFVADFSIYVARSDRGMGVGSALMAAIIESAKERGYHKLVLSAFPQNSAGMSLYARFGFREVGIYREQGVIDGKWVDTIIMERMLDDEPPPADR